MCLSSRFLKLGGVFLCGEISKNSLLAKKMRMVFDFATTRMLDAGWGEILTPTDLLKLKDIRSNSRLLDSSFYETFRNISCSDNTFIMIEINRQISTINKIWRASQRDIVIHR